MADQADGILSSWLREQRIKIVIPFIKGTVLDYGCGVGALAKLYSPENYCGVDIDEESIKIARQAFPAHTFETHVPGLGGKKFDTIVLLAVIEHIKLPKEFLIYMKEMLNHNGQIILTTPHPRVERIHHIGSRVGLFSAHANDEHEKLIDYKRMHGIASDAGFDILTYKRFLLGANQLFVLTTR